jgi:hypothetical protein
VLNGSVTERLDTIMEYVYQLLVIIYYVVRVSETAPRISVCDILKE